jgi:hypothetical protein
MKKIKVSSINLHKKVNSNKNQIAFGSNIKVYKILRQYLPSVNSFKVNLNHLEKSRKESFYI